MRTIIVYIFLLLLPMTASAGNEKLSQKQLRKDISTIKSNLKASKDLEKSETTLRKYLADSTFCKQKNLHLLLIESLRKQYEAGNEKMYLKQKADTATILKTNIRQFLAIEAFDSIDAMPDSKGVSTPSYRKKHAQYLMPFRGNMLKGGIYFYAHSQWQDAWTSLDTYLDCRRQPLFAQEQLDTTHTTFAAFLAVMSAYNIADLNRALKYAPEALLYTPRREMTLQRLADISIQKGDTVHYRQYLEEGNRSYPYSTYFFPNLIDLHTTKKEYSKALGCADEALKKDSLNQTFLLARHNVLMMLQRYDEALKAGKALLLQNDTLAIPNYNVACIYYQKAQEAMKQSGKTYKQRTKEAQQYYTLCRPYMEKYRALMPQDKALWKPVLYDVYLNLNMGREFEKLSGN